MNGASGKPSIQSSPLLLGAVPFRVSLSCAGLSYTSDMHCSQ